MRGTVIVEIMAKVMYPVMANHIGMLSLKNTSFRFSSSRGCVWSLSVEPGVTIERFQIIIVSLITFN